MVIREIVENFIHAHFAEPIISILTAETPSALLTKDPASTTRNALSTLALPVQTAR
ncbi:MAG: hypothetical protein ACLTYW_09865 [Collinsella sp.]